MANTKDYYDTLGVSKNSSADEIKRAYRKLALEYHPDRNKSKDAEIKFKEVTKAYEVLGDPQKRQTYDQFGAAAFEQGAGQNPFAGGQRAGQYGPFSYTYTTNGGGQDFDFGGFSDPFEIFEQFFGGASPFSNRQRRPVYSLTITFDDAVHGAEKNVHIDGKSQRIKIPAGVDNGSRIRFGDYDVVISVTANPRFQREGADIVSEEEISFAKASLGDEIEIETVNGPVTLRIPAGTQPGTVFRLRGKGVPYIRREGSGDHYVRVKIVVPKHLTRRQKELLEELDEGSQGKKNWF